MQVEIPIELIESASAEMISNIRNDIEVELRKSINMKTLLPEIKNSIKSQVVKEIVASFGREIEVRQVIENALEKAERGVNAAVGKKLAEGIYIQVKGLTD